ncbi:MAG: hypothetical protein WBA13_01145 [Microcoleaceae cyanobacterium]
MLKTLSLVTTATTQQLEETRSQPIKKLLKVYKVIFPFGAILGGKSLPLEQLAIAIRIQKVGAGVAAYYKMCSLPSALPQRARNLILVPLLQTIGSLLLTPSPEYR